jgi:hypothetical protein
MEQSRRDVAVEPRIGLPPHHERRRRNGAKVDLLHLFYPQRARKIEQVRHALGADERREVTGDQPLGHVRRGGHRAAEHGSEQRLGAEHAAAEAEDEARRVPLQRAHVAPGMSSKATVLTRIEPGHAVGAGGGEPERHAAAHVDATTTARATRSTVIARSRYSACAATPKSASSGRSLSPWPSRSTANAVWRAAATSGATARHRKVHVPKPWRSTTGSPPWP